MFVGFQNHVTLPDILAPALGANAPQPTIDGQVQMLNLYCALLVNTQGLIVHLLNQNIQNIQNQLAPQSMIKAPKPEFNGTPGEKAHRFITACTMYQTLWPNDFLNDKVFIAWALACINNDSKAASWKAHCLMLHTENIGAGCAQPVTLADWDTFACKFLGKFTDLSNQALLWLFHQSLKNNIQHELLCKTFNTLEQLQSTVITTDNLLFSFRKQNPGDWTTN